MLKNTVFITILAGILVFGAGCLDPNAAAAPGAANQPPAEDPFDPDRPPTAKTLYLMADMLAAQGKDAEAERLYRRIVGQYPEFLPAYNELAALLMRQRRIPEAMKILEAGTELQPDDPVLLNNTGMCWLIRKRYQRALDSFTKASAVVPENTRYRSNMATALALMGRYDEALSLYRQILPEQQARENVRILKENIKTIQ
ncbi:MAG: tetratricopeptide repeat protein [Planctomycetota bacterium]|jgi:Flp pilus assembly protein TadD